MSSSPVIGITKPEKGDNLAYFAISSAVRLVGGQPLEMTTSMSWRETYIQGLIIGGGSDVFPPHYHQDAVEGAQYDQGRDEMEMYWARKARDTNLPTLAICRGAQVMNVASGGSLHQKLDEIYEDVDYPSTIYGQIFYRKEINIDPQSLLSEIVSSDTAHVNSIHKQAIAETGENLTVTARERNGVIQAIEDKSRPYYLGVQFHPEFLIHRTQFRNIFKKLVEISHPS
ncbi:MAG: gamma-glutamyl-gamma-aminobutyrate hydrolase family protein [Pseudomonadota bacterium]